MKRWSSVSRYIDRIARRCAYERGLGEQDGEDIAQISKIVVLNRVGCGGRLNRRYVTGIVRWTSFGLWRSMRKRSFATLDGGGRENAHAAVMRALEDLDPKERALIELRFFEGLTLRKLSQMFSRSITTIWRDIDRILAKLRDDDELRECYSV